MSESAGFLSAAQEDDLRAWVGASLPRTTRQVGAWIEQHFGLQANRYLCGEDLILINERKQATWLRREAFEFQRRISKLAR